MPPAVIFLSGRFKELLTGRGEALLLLVAQVLLLVLFRVQVEGLACLRLLWLTLFRNGVLQNACLLANDFGLSIV